MIDIILGIFILISFLVFYNLANNVKKCIEYCVNIPTTDISKPVSIIKPSKGQNEYTFTNYVSWINQKYDAPIEYIFSFDTKNDPGINLAQKVPYKNKKILINPITEGFTGKTSAINHGLKKSKHEYIIFSDSDTLAKDDTLAKIMTQFTHGAKIVTCLAIYNHTKNIWSRIYASTWNLVEIGIVGNSIINKGDQVVGNTFALTKETLKQIGGIDKYKNFIAEDIAIGKNAHKANYPVLLGPMIESPVGKMNYTNVNDKFSRAALYAITMRGLKRNWQFVMLYSYFLLLIPPAGLLGTRVFLPTIVIAFGRLILASYLWYITTGEKRVFIECFLGDILFFLIYIRSFIFRTTKWSGIKYQVESTGTMRKIMQDK